VNELIIEVNSINKSFSGQKVIDNLSFAVNRGEIVGFLGPNGSGKTTTIRLLNGVITPDSGQIMVWGLDPNSSGEEIRRRSGVMTESAGLYRSLSGIENLRFFAGLYGLNKPEARINELLVDFGLEEAKDKKVGAYSTGMKKRLGIAKALLHSPELLFLDEPTTGLDPEGTRDLLTYIEELNRKYQVTIFLCTHLLKQVERLCHKFIFITSGQILESGTLTEIEAKYLGEVNFKVETGLELLGNHFQGFPIVGREPGHVVFRVENKARIPEILKAVLSEAPVYGAEIMGRDLETLYFKVLASKNH
jgi:ABC-2 type transport system ATP-binding protein